MACADAGYPEGMVPGQDFSFPRSYEEFETNYKKGRFVGDGGWSGVFMVKDKNSNVSHDIVAKYTLIKGKDWKDLQKNALQEIKICHAVQGLDLKSGHENVLKLHGWYAKPNTRAGRLFSTVIALFDRCACDLEYCFRRMNRRCTEEEAKPVLQQIAQGLRFMYGKNIAHRDIKMANILCDHPTELTPLKLCDFDLGRYISATQRPSPMKNAVETESYMDPQRLMTLQGSESVVFRRKCDAWSVGHIMYELLTTRALYEELSQCGQRGSFAMRGTSWDEKMYKHHENCKEQNFSLRTSKPFNPEEFEDVAARSEGCKAMLIGLLNISEEERFDMDDVLRHTWLSNC